MAAPIPRDPPVTRATLPASEPNSGSAERLLEPAERLRIADGHRLERAVAAAQEPGQDLAGADLDEHADAFLHEAAHGLSELHGGRELVDKQVDEASCVLEPRRH